MMKNRKPLFAFGAGATVGTLGGLIGLGGAEFRLPILIGFFGFGALPALILNKATSLAVVASALPFRAWSVPWSSVFAHWSVVVTLLAGSLLGAWKGAGWATKLHSRTLYRTLALLLVGIAFALIFGHDATGSGAPIVSGWILALTGSLVGFGIGVVASLMGVAGGELLIPTIVLLFGADIRLAGSLSLAVSLPTMLVGFARYSKDKSFEVLRAQLPFVTAMVLGSFVGAFVGSRLLGLIPINYLLPALAAILLVSAIKVWKHE